MHALTKCNNCGFTCRNLKVSETCIACTRGTMQQFSENDRERWELARLEAANELREINRQHMS